MIPVATIAHRISHRRVGQGYTNYPLEHLVAQLGTPQVLALGPGIREVRRGLARRFEKVNRIRTDEVCCISYLSRRAEMSL